jgi:hypothetical protein
MTTAKNLTYWYCNVAGQGGTITYSSGASGTPTATSKIIVNPDQPLSGMRGMSKITMALDTDNPSQTIA